MEKQRKAEIQKLIEVNYLDLSGKSTNNLSSHGGIDF
jgi:hypothetical protein